MSTGGIVSSRDFPIQSEKALGPIPVQEPRSGARAKGAGCRVQGEECEGAQVGRLEEVELHLHVTGVIQGDCGIRYV